MRFRSLRRCTRAAVRVLFRVVSGFHFGIVSGFLFGLLLACFGFSFWVPLYTFCVLRGAFMRSLVVGLGFLCILEALCILVFVYLEALCTFFDIIL
jgi:hypothetical protein